MNPPKTINSPKTSASTTNPPSHFHSFPHLPLELRHLIWTLVLPGPRVIEVIISSIPTPRWICVQESCHPTPVIGAVCRESRGVYLGTWVPFLPIHKTSEPHGTARSVMESSGISFINPRIDTLYISLSPGIITLALFNSLATHPALKNLHTLLLNWREMEYLNKSSRGDTPIAIFQGTRRLTVVVNDTNYGPALPPRPKVGIKTWFVPQRGHAEGWRRREVKEVMGGFWKRFGGLVGGWEEEEVGLYGVVWRGREMRW
ncbi:hypothetical protein BJ875DRAFT_546765 [Amylocarpus encephaloides]|uniref:2EXR domain-containing protein n=1 Tax=Amylocarpus encephaloides TaxID=45428 RepID=A0A9P8C204_9HELO|nr:hypothetical protein BJ875DRAFT_546765 [Amylocarpus encephaloides]